MKPSRSLVRRGRKRLSYLRCRPRRRWAEDWQRQGQTFSGLWFGNQLGVTVGTYVKDRELIAKATDPVEWVTVIQHLPYP